MGYFWDKDDDVLKPNRTPEQREEKFAAHDRWEGRHRTKCAGCGRSWKAHKRHGTSKNGGPTIDRKCLRFVVPAGSEADFVEFLKEAK